MKTNPVPSCCFAVVVDGFIYLFIYLLFRRYRAFLSDFVSSRVGLFVDELFAEATVAAAEAEAGPGEKGGRPEDTAAAR